MSSCNRLATNIATLYALDDFQGEEETPEMPQIRWNEQYTLALHHERQLAEAFAFLAATTDNMYKVMAVAIEEHADSKGITVRLACNISDISKQKEGLESITRKLQQVALTSNASFECEEIQQQLLTEVLRCCYQRILSRLRSRHRQTSRKTSNKRPLTEQLLDSLPHTSTSAPSATLNQLSDVAHRLAALFNIFESSAQRACLTDSSKAPLAELVQEAHYLGKSQDLKSVLQAQRDVQPSLASSLPNSFAKVGHYFAITMALLQAVKNKRSTVFRNISVEVAETQTVSPDFHLPPTQSLYEIIMSFDVEHGRGTRRYGNLSSAFNRFASTRLKSHRKTVHAELQLLFFYETNTTVKRPRIICASKSACFLCNQFILLHGRFIPHCTHGRVYPLWGLPACALRKIDNARDSMAYVVERMNEVLERKIVTILSQPASGGRDHPSESLLHTLAIWTPASSAGVSRIRSPAPDLIHSETLENIRSPPGTGFPDPWIETLLDRLRSSTESPDHMISHGNSHNMFEDLPHKKYRPWLKGNSVATDAPKGHNASLCAASAATDVRVNLTQAKRQQTQRARIWDDVRTPLLPIHRQPAGEPHSDSVWSIAISMVTVLLVSGAGYGIWRAWKSGFSRN